MSDEIGGEKKRADEDAEERADFVIRELPDLRRLRKAYLKCGDEFAAVDAAGTPLPHDGEKDFGLRRSTREEALEFLKQLIEDADAGPDDMTEFLQDE